MKKGRGRNGMGEKRGEGGEEGRRQKRGRRGCEGRRNGGKGGRVRGSVKHGRREEEES